MCLLCCWTWTGGKNVWRIWEDNDATRLYREKIRRVKSHLELNLATAVKDNKCCYIHISNKRRTKENPHPLLDEGENIVTRSEVKAEVFNAFFASVFISKTNCSRSTQPAEPTETETTNRNREQNKTLIIQGEMVTDLLHHLDTHKSVW